MSTIGPMFIALVGGIIGLAIIAVLVGQRAQTADVLTSGGTALASIIGRAVNPQSNNFGSATAPNGASQ
jgi:hypothetical protein